VSGPPAIQRSPADHAAAREHTDTVTALLEATMTRASTFSTEEQKRSVNEEWSTVESLQHVVFVIDLWLGKVIGGEGDPFHPIGLPPHFVPRQFPGSSIDPDADPSFHEACDVLRGRLATLSAYVDALTPEELARPIGTHAENVAGGLGVVFDELTYHDGFMNRDLDAIEVAR
jgi:hypothetical protein